MIEYFENICRNLSGKINSYSRSFLAGLFFATAILTAGASGWKLSNEVLTYNIMYKWGLINKKAGEVSLSTSGANQTEFKSTLLAATAPWADKFYHVRDTLLGTINTRTFFPSRYERVAHEGSRYSHDILSYSRENNKVTANAQLWRKKKKEPMWTDQRVHQAEGTTLDMLSSFYYMRHIDFPSMKDGSAVKMNIFSGKKKEFLTIHYRGISEVKIGEQKYKAYHITFTFTQEGGKVSSDNMDAWISTESHRIPLLMEGKLPVGKVRAIYSGSLNHL